MLKRKVHHTSEQRIILKDRLLEFTIQRLCRQIVENYYAADNLVLMGIQPRGVFLSRIIQSIISHSKEIKSFQYAEIDVTFYRDDFKMKTLLPSPQQIAPEFSIDNKKVVLIDDVLYTGRTIRAAMDAIQDYGRPQCVELLVLVNRRFSRQLPIEPTYSGISIDSFDNQTVLIEWHKNWKKSKVYLEHKTNTK